MFSRIARRYDLMNSLMTAGRHHAWRAVVARAAAAAPPGPALDLATGTADLALALRALDPTRLVVGADFSEGMLAEARLKLRARRATRVALLAADALTLPFADKTFACVTSAFLLRNLADLSAGLAQMRRVTMPGGLVAALEITRPGVPAGTRCSGSTSIAWCRCSARWSPATALPTPTCRSRSSASSRRTSWRASWRRRGSATSTTGVAASAQLPSTTASPSAVSQKSV